MSISQINNYESKVQPVLRPALSQAEFQTESEESDLGFRYYFFKILFRVDLSLCNTGSLFSKSSRLVDFKF
ncbi:hypothetical protein LEP1GSC082_4137 [Leptospira kirschneri str. H2]|nr:hypothetical protein LEP1GSC082_4137 [Leptospira kirschneri str. H2]